MRPYNLSQKSQRSGRIRESTRLLKSDGHEKDYIFDIPLDF